MTGVAVLLVDDDVHFREAVSDALEEFGCFVVQAINGKHALELFHSRHFELVITDNNMPVMTGIEFIKEIRKTCSTPALLMTGGVTSEQTALNAGASAFFSKPLCMDELQKFLSDLS